MGMINFEQATRAIWDARPDIRDMAGPDWPDSGFYIVIPEWWCLASPPERDQFGGDLVSYALTYLGGSLGRQPADTCSIFQTLWDCRPDFREAFPYAVADPNLIPRAIAGFWHGVLERNPTYHGDIYDYVAKGSGVDCGGDGGGNGGGDGGGDGGGNGGGDGGGDDLISGLPNWLLLAAVVGVGLIVVKKATD